MNMKIDLISIIVLFIIFIILKIVGVIPWSWTWVLCPLWIPIVVIATVMTVTFFITVIRVLIDVIKYKWEIRKNRKDNEWSEIIK